MVIISHPCISALELAQAKLCPGELNSSDPGIPPAQVAVQTPGDKQAYHIGRLCVGAFVVDYCMFMDIRYMFKN